MSHLVTNFLLFAQEAAAEAGAAEGQAKGGGNQLMQFLPFIVLALLFWFFMMRPQQQERKKHQEALDNLKKNDQVQTIGGIIGTVVNLDEKYVTLKVDDNAKIKMRRTSIQGLLEDDK